MQLLDQCAGLLPASQFLGVHQLIRSWCASNRLTVIEYHPCSHDFSEDVLSFSCPDEGFRCLVMLVDVLVERLDQFEDAPEHASPLPFSVRSRKNRSTLFSHEALVGVK